MKTKSFIALCMLVAMFCSCASMSNSTTNSSSSTSTTSGYTTGQTMGMSMKALYSQYKAEGALNMNNLSTIANIAALSSACNTLKTNTKESAFYKEFLQGVVAGSSNMVTENTAESVVSSVASTVNNLDLSSIISAATAGSTSNVPAATSNNVGSSITSLMSLLGNK